MLQEKEKENEKKIYTCAIHYDRLVDDSKLFDVLINLIEIVFLCY